MPTRLLLLGALLLSPACTRADPDETGDSSLDSGLDTADCGSLVPYRKRIDSDGDGAQDGEDLYTYDDQDKLRILRKDLDLDGQVDQEFRYAWTEGLLVSEEWDRDNDGAVDRRITYSHDDRGLLVLTLVDLDVDGSPDLQIETSWDEEGKKTRSHTQSLDGGGTNDVVLYLYEAGVLVRVDIDFGNDDSVELRSDFSWEGLTQTERVSELGSDYAELWTRGFDEAGNKLTEIVDFGEDGEVDFEDAWTWEGGRLLHHESRSGDGSSISLADWDYCPV